MKKRLLALLLVIAAVSLVLAACHSNVTVTFDPQNGENPKVVTFDKHFSLPKEPVKEGYLFTGWYLDKECEVKWNPPKKLSNSITVYAGWEVDPDYDAGGGGGTGGGTELSLSEIFALYNDYSKWNFQITYSMYVNGDLDMQDVLQYKGEDIAMQWNDYETGDPYVDYFVYDSAKGQYAYYVQDDNGVYQRYYSVDNKSDFDNAYQIDYVELINLSTLSFTKNGNKYSANNAAAAGVEILGEYDGETFQTLDLYVANNKISKIEATSKFVENSTTYNCSYTLVFSEYGKINFTVPQVGSTGGGDIGGGNTGTVTTNTSMFKDKNLAVDSGCLEYSSNVDREGWQSDRGVQFSKKGNIVVTSKTSVSGVTKVEVVCATNVSGGVTVSVFVGSTELTAATGSTVSSNKNTTLTFTSSKALSGTVQVKISGGSSKSVWIYSVAVTGTGVGGSASADVVTLNQTSLILEVDGTAVLTATATSGGTVTWKSSDNGIATVDQNGNVKAVGKGTATITASCGTASATCTVRVVDASEFFGWNVASPSGVQTPVLQAAILNDDAIGLPSIGTYDVLVIPVEFTDAPFTDTDLANLNLAFNDTTGATGWESVKSFYQKSSGGLLNLNFKILGVNFGYKGQVFKTGMKSTQLKDEQPLVKSAIDYLDEQGVDFSQFDTNGDGCIDAVYMVYSCDLNDTDQDSLFWAWVGYYGDTYVVDGVEPYYYFWVSKEFMSYYDFEETTRIKINAETFIHETGHLLSLDDYYDYETGTGSDKGLGCAAMMDFNMGDHDPYSKIMLGWLTPTVITYNTSNTTATINLSDSNKNNDVLLIRLDSGTNYLCEYLLIDIYNNTNLNAYRSSELYGGKEFGARIFHVSSAADRHYNTSDYYSFTNDNNSYTTNSLIRLVGAKTFDSSFGKNFATAAELWQTGGYTKEAIHSYYTNKAVTITFTSVTSTGATVSISYS